MAKAKITKPSHVVERNIRLTGVIMQYLMDNPQVFNALPDIFELVILPEDDPEMRLYNLELLDEYGSEGRSSVFARIKTQTGTATMKEQPRLFAPIQMAA